MTAERSGRGREASPAARRLSLFGYFVGAGLGTVFLSSTLSTGMWVIAAALLTLLHAARPWARSDRPARRAIGVTAWAASFALHALWVYLSIAWAGVLAWSVPWWGYALVATAAAGVLATAPSARAGARVPVALPLGLWIALCLRGWHVEESVVRCDDYLATVRDPAVRVIAPTSRRLPRCAPGERVAVRRFPRIILEASDGERLIVTTQPAISVDGERMIVTTRTADTDPKTYDPDARFTGSVCEVRPGRSDDPRCFGTGKAQGLVESAALDRIFVGNWGHFPGGVRGQVLAFSRRAPLTPLGSAQTPQMLGDFFYDPDADRLYGLTDEGGEIIPIVASTMAREPSVPAPLFGPGATRYDGARHEGILCVGSGPHRMGGRPYMAVAVRGAPLALRPLGGDDPLAWVTMSWGCDLDVTARRAYVAVPNLGLLATLDYDSGRVLRRDFVGFNLRSVTLDRARRRVYLTDFLGGSVSAVDLATGREVRRWRTGRFARSVTLSRDGASLLVAANVGVVSIRLEPPP